MSTETTQSAFYSDPEALAAARAAEAPAQVSPGVVTAPPRPAAPIERSAAPSPSTGRLTAADRPSVVDMVNSLTGFDLIAITKAFGSKFSDLDKELTVYALVFVLKRRQGASDADAFAEAMTIPLGEMDGHFAIDQDTDGAVDVSGLTLDEALQAVQHSPEA